MLIVVERRWLSAISLSYIHDYILLNCACMPAHNNSNKVIECNLEVSINRVSSCKSRVLIRWHCVIIHARHLRCSSILPRTLVELINVWYTTSLHSLPMQGDARLGKLTVSVIRQLAPGVPTWGFDFLNYKQFRNIPIYREPLIGLFMFHWNRMFTIR